MAYQRLAQWDSAPRVSKEEPVMVGPSNSHPSTGPSAKQVYFKPPKASVISEAVENVIKEHAIPAHAAQTFRETYMRDPKNAAVSEYFRARQSVQIREKDYAFDTKFHVRYRLTEREAQVILAYMPEHRVILDGVIAHDHPLLAAMRHCDFQLVKSKVPAGVTVLDVGGDPLYHIHHENVHVHVCNPLADPKDAARAVSRVLKAEIAQVDGKRSAESRVVAGRFLAATQSTVDEALKASEYQFCRRKVQDCSMDAGVLTCVHVYDIPINDWPDIIEKHSSFMVIGALHYSPRFLETSQGVLDRTRISYKVDTKDDVFVMGFQGSPAWHYRHKWSEYIKYGVNRILVSSTGRAYSYVVEELRFDTLFFRILPMNSSPTKDTVLSVCSQYQQIPGTPRVRVRGFKIDHTGDAGATTELRRCDYEFPLYLWDRMVVEASVQYEAMNFNHTKLVNYYRSIVPKQSINSTVTMGGYSVDVMQLPALIVHSTLCAAMRVSIGRHTTRAMTDDEFMSRMRRDEGTFMKVLKTIADVSISAISLPIYPFRLLYRLLRSYVEGKYEQHMLISWEPVADVIHVPVKVSDAWRDPETALDMLHSSKRAQDRQAYCDRSLFHNSVRRAMVGNRELMERIGDNPLLPETFRAAAKFSASRMPQDSPTTLESPVAFKFPPKTTDNTSTTLVDEITTYEHPVHVVQAIQEAIREVTLEIEVAQSACKRAWRVFNSSGRVDEARLKLLADNYDGPLFWRVEDNSVVRAVDSRPMSEFEHSAVCWYQGAGSPVLVISRVKRQSADVYKIAERCGSTVVMTINMLKIYNGPEVLSALQESLQTPARPFTVRLYDGVPGCGKTYSIIQQFNAETDLVLCPARASATDTRERLESDKGLSASLAKSRVRTLDSFLVNLRTTPIVQDVSRILADEVFMSHSGKWYAAAILNGVSTILAYGDSKQIPHIPRVQIIAMHVRIKPDEVYEMLLSRRVPPDGVAAWNPCYGNRARSSNPVPKSLHRLFSLDEVRPSSKTAFITMYQAEKTVLRQYIRDKFPKLSAGVAVLTAHEAQGKTFEHVVLYRHDTRPRHDTASLYDTEGHVIVAMSRHTRRFDYVCAALMKDLVDTFIANATAINTQATADIETIGVAY